MSKNIYSFKGKTLPRTIILDTSVILNLLTKFTRVTTHHPRDCEIFIERILKNNTEIYLTDWTIQEVLFVVTRWKLQEECRKKKRPSSDWEFFYKRRPDVINKFYSALKTIYNELIKIGCNRKLEESSFAIRDKMIEIIGTKKLLPSDAYIIATAIVNKHIEATATCDRAFTRAADMVDIYLPDALII